MDILAVARRAGVSTATVSRVLNHSTKVREATAARVRKAIEDLDYVPNNGARIMRSGRSNIYGILLSDIRNPFFPDIIEHFEALAAQHGINVTFANTGYSEERFLIGARRLMERGIDGLAVLTSEISPPAFKKIRDAAIPVVFLNQPTAAGSFRNIVVDYLRGFREAVEHLSMLGHTRIGFVAGPPSFSSAARRREAFLHALETARLRLHPELLFQGDHRITGGQFAAERIFSMPEPPTGVICSNDMTAIGILHTAQRLGRKIPQELSLIGFDDLFLSEIVQPALTTIHLSRKEIATRAFFALQSASTESTAAQISTILPHLIIRASTAGV